MSFREFRPKNKAEKMTSDAIDNGKWRTLTGAYHIFPEDESYNN